MGSGNITISLAKHLAFSKIIATDINEQALATAKANAELNGVLERINFISHDILTGDLNDEFDIVVSNPPYISEKEFPELKDELKVYEPKNALTDFSNGLSYYKTISFKAKKLLRDKGKIFFEVGQGQAEDVRKILDENNFTELSVIKDYLKIDRVISGVRT